jgi:transcriptional regulator with XRE-family HTH domain
MPKVSRFHLPPVDFGGETLGQRLARIRKERGFTQAELAARVGIIQSIVSAAENGERKLSAEMAVRFARALEVGMDELLGPGRPPKRAPQASRKVLRRLDRIQTLPPGQQSVLLKTIDTFLENEALRGARR